jgi:hypothetical protein
MLCAAKVQITCLGKTSSIPNSPGLLRIFSCGALAMELNVRIGILCSLSCRQKRRLTRGVWRHRMHYFIFKYAKRWLFNTKKKWATKSWKDKEDSQSEEATYHTAPTIWHYRRGKITRTVRRSGVATGWQGRKLQPSNSLYFINTQTSLRYPTKVVRLFFPRTETEKLQQNEH